MEKQIISKVEQQKRQGRFNIYIGNEYAFAVAETVLIKFNLFKGRELTPLLIDEIKQADQQAKALQVAYMYLSQQLRSTYEVKQKLRQAEVDENTIELIIERLTAEHLIDDLAFAQSLVRTLAKTSLKGPRIVQQTLIQKHIEPDVVTIALTEYQVEWQVENATKLYLQLAKRYQKLAGFAKEQKLSQSLFQKGYSQTIIQQVMQDNEISSDRDDELENLKQLATKLWQRNRRYDALKRKIKTQQSLYAKGFQIDDIQMYVTELAAKEELD